MKLPQHDSTEVTFKKGEILQRAGDLNTKAYLVKKGLLRSYTIDEKGKEHIFLFAPEGWLIADNTLPDQPAELFIDALEDTVAHVLKKEIGTLEPDFLALFRRLSVLQKRIIMLMSSPAIQRYEHFIETYPEIIQRVPQRMIASYLGITPEALSKVKAEQAKGK